MIRTKTECITVALCCCMQDLAQFALVLPQTCVVTTEADVALRDIVHTCPRNLTQKAEKHRDDACK